MSKTDKLAAKGDPWDTGELGRDEQYAKRATPEKEIEVDAALGLQLISIRLQKKMIEDLKFIAKAHGVGYQPLIRDILDRFIAHEVKAIVREVQSRREQEEIKRIEAENLCKANENNERKNRIAA
jgi:uncharacterized protein (DUF4415 family)